MHAWFSRLCYHKRINVCVALEGLMLFSLFNLLILLLLDLDYADSYGTSIYVCVALVGLLLFGLLPKLSQSFYPFVAGSRL